MYRSSEPMSLDAPLTAEDGAELTIADSVADSSANVEESVIEDVVNEESKPSMG
jgi:DNA-directed RNA polymerase sigma subunit (sigma70/sigma32)